MPDATGSGQILQAFGTFYAVAIVDSSLHRRMIASYEDGCREGSLARILTHPPRQDFADDDVSRLALEIALYAAFVFAEVEAPRHLRKRTILGRRRPDREQIEECRGALKELLRTTLPAIHPRLAAAESQTPLAPAGEEGALGVGRLLDLLDAYAALGEEEAAGLFSDRVASVIDQHNYLAAKGIGMGYALEIAVLVRNCAKHTFEETA